MGSWRAQKGYTNCLFAVSCSASEGSMLGLSLQLPAFTPPTPPPLKVNNTIRQTSLTEEHLIPTSAVNKSKDAQLNQITCPNSHR
jgi:hypothetical protein